MTSHERRTILFPAAAALLGCAVAACGPLPPSADLRSTAAAAAVETPREPAVATAPPTPTPTPTGPTGPRLLGPVEAQPSFTPPRQRPNFLLITLDDATVSDFAHMPRTQRLLARQGTTFEAVAPTPICVPARASILTGQYAHNHGALTIHGPDGGFDSFRDRRTLPVWLRRSGYDTLFVGKYLNHYGEVPGSSTYVPPGWSDWRGSLDPSTYSMDRSVLNDNGRVRRENTYQTDAYADEVRDMLRRPRRQRAPWLLWVNYVAPHHAGPVESDDPPADHARTVQTTLPAPRHRNMFRGTRIPRSPNLFATERGAPRSAPSSSLTWSRRGRAAVREAYQQRLESLQSVDQAVASHVRTLRRTGQLRNTYVVLHSDNGFATGNHQQFGKLWHYRESSSIPLIVRGPGIRRGVRSATTFTTPDIPVSFAAAARAEPLRRVDGVNVFAHLRGRSQGQRVVPMQAWPVYGGRRIYHGVRAGDWTYARFRNGAEEVFRRSTDPAEMRNLARNPRFSTQVRQLRRLARQYRTCRGEECPQTFWRG